MASHGGREENCIALPLRKNAAQKRGERKNKKKKEGGKERDKKGGGRQGFETGKKIPFVWYWKTSKGKKKESHACPDKKGGFQSPGKPAHWLANKERGKKKKVLKKKKRKRKKIWWRNVLLTYSSERVLCF